MSLKRQIAEINIFRLNICYMDKLVEEHYIFVGDYAEEFNYGLSEIPFLKYNNNEIMTCANVAKNCTFELKFSPNKSKFHTINMGFVKFNHFGNGSDVYIHLRNDIALSKKRVIINMDGYALSSFIQCLTYSPKYVHLVMDYLSRMCCIMETLYPNNNIGILYLQINLLEPERHIMDLQWAKMACVAIHELRQLQYTLSWLSTLGGAFSALGEQQEKCAINAGVISMEQLRLAIKLGDAIIITQCKLYFSLSLIQRGYCRLARTIIQEQYKIIKNSYVFDRKTSNMCKGIWARLKYETQRRRLAKKISNKSP